MHISPSINQGITFHSACIVPASWRSAEEHTRSVFYHANDYPRTTSKSCVFFACHPFASTHGHYGHLSCSDCDSSNRSAAGLAVVQNPGVFRCAPPPYPGPYHICHGLISCRWAGRPQRGTGASSLDSLHRRTHQSDFSASNSSLSAMYPRVSRPGNGQYIFRCAMGLPSVHSERSPHGYDDRL